MHVCVFHFYCTAVLDYSKMLSNDFGDFSFIINVTLIRGQIFVWFDLDNLFSFWKMLSQIGIDMNPKAIKR